MYQLNRTIFSCILFLVIWGCDNNVVDPKPTDVNEEATPDSLFINGTGIMSFNAYQPLSDRPVNLFYHIPDRCNSASPIMFAIHGNGRDAELSRDLLIDESERYRFILLAPEFSRTHYPGSDAFHMGNIFEDGDNPSGSTLNDEAEWTYSIFDPIFEWFRDTIGSDAQVYDLFGHSAGGQVAHRFFIYKPNSKVHRVVAGAPGWYTVPDTGITFPYGTGGSLAVETYPDDLFDRRLIVVVGSEDIDPNSAGLRHNAIVDLQGLNRLDRARHFHARSAELADEAERTYRWELHIIPNAGHDYAATSNKAAVLLYE